MSFIRRYIIAGLLVWLPIWVTLLVLGFLAHILEGGINLLPPHLRPEYLFGFNIPGLGVLISLLVLLLTGMLATNFFGRRLVNLWEMLLGRIPLVRSVYTSAKQLVNTLFSPQGNSFRKVLLVEYPRPGSWSVGFQAGEVYHEISAHTGVEMISVFIPTTPNPTSGFLIMVPKTEVVELDMGIEAGFKFIVSLGVVQPNKIL